MNISELPAATYATASYALYVPPKPVGSYRLDRIRFMFIKKPSAWHRFWMKLALGFVWEDEPVEAHKQTLDAI